jgi:ATP-binding cassette subfamily F protein uup
LILDEPTNDLDIFTLQVLEEFLMDFPGCLIIVSHDRYFMDRLVEHVWVLGESGQTAVRFYPGNYTQYRLARAEALEDAKAAQAAQKSAAAPKETAQPEVRNDYSARLSFKEKYELEQLEKEMPDLEARKAALESELATASDHSELTRISEELGAVATALDTAEMRWLELSERA